MKTVKIIGGLTWAFLCLLIIIGLFPALNPLATATSKLPFMKINPNYSGSYVVKEIAKANYTINIRKPVFSGLIGERKNGFVQIDWRGKLPKSIIDTIDYDDDSKKDFIVQIDTLNAQSNIISLNPKVGEINVSTRTSYGWAVRVGLVK
jgi:hypothetical protein